MLTIPIINVHASDTIKARIGDNYYDSLEDAIIAANSTDTIFLTGNSILDKTLEINKTVNINLNNNNIEAPELVFLVQGGSLNLTGKGTIRETKPNYGAIMLKGSEDPNKENYSTVSVGKDVTLEGWSGIFINHLNNTGYGILANVNGTIKAVDDVNNGSGAGIYVNGNIQHENNSPIINLTNTTKITSTGNGIYSAGYATYNINGAYIEGAESGLGIKSGVFNIKNGTIIGTGEDKTPTSGNNNGINASGTAIQIESNNGYKGDIELNINNGNIKSKKSYTIYEYTTNNSPTQVKSINLTGGTYISPSNKSVFSVSDSFKSTHNNFISGGIYTSNPEAYLKNGYNATLNENNEYEVLHVFKENKQVKENAENNDIEKKENNNLFKIILIISITILICSIIFFNRKKIFIIF